MDFIVRNQKLVLGEDMCLEFPVVRFQNDAAGKKLFLDHVVLLWNCARPVGRSADVAVGRYNAKLVCHSDRKEPPFSVQLLPSHSGPHKSAPPDFLRQNLATHPAWIHLVKLWQSYLATAPSSAFQASNPLVPPAVHASLSSAPWGSPLSQAAMDPRYFQDPRLLSYINPYQPPLPPVAAPASPVDAAAVQAQAQVAAAQAQAQAAASQAQAQLQAQAQAQAQAQVQAQAAGLWSHPTGPVASPGQAARTLVYDTPPQTPQSSTGAPSTQTGDGAPVGEASQPDQAGVAGKRPPSPNLTPSAAKKPAESLDLATLAQKVAQLEAANAMLAEQLNSAFPKLEARLDTSFSEIRAQVAQLETQVPLIQQSGESLVATVSNLSATLTSFQADTEASLAAHRLALDSMTAPSSQ